MVRSLPLMLVLLCTSIGCASTVQYVPFPKRTEPMPPDTARIYVLRPALFGSAVPMGVYDGDVKVGETGPGGYLCWHRPAGEVTLRGQAENKSSITVTAEAGEKVFVEQKVVMGILFARNKLVKLGKTKGLDTLGNCKKGDIEVNPTSAARLVAASANASAGSPVALASAEPVVVEVPEDEQKLREEALGFFLDRCGIDPAGPGPAAAQGQWDMFRARGYEAERIYRIAYWIPEPCNYASFNAAVMVTERTLTAQLTPKANPTASAELPAGVSTSPPPAPDGGWELAEEVEVEDFEDRDPDSPPTGFRFTYMYGPTWPMGPDSRLAQLMEDAIVPPQPSFFWGARFAGGHGFDVNLRLQIVTVIGGSDEFAFPLSFLYHIPLSPRTPVGVYVKPGITFFNLMAGGYYDVGIGPSLAIGVEFLQHKRIHIPLELRYEPLWNAQPDDPEYGEIDFGGMTLAVGISF